MLGLTAAKNGMAISARNVGSACVSRTISLRRGPGRSSMALPSARGRRRRGRNGSPASLRRSAARSMSLERRSGHGRAVCRCRSPLRIVKVYVFPSRDTTGMAVAPSPARRSPRLAGPALAGRTPSSNRGHRHPHDSDGSRNSKSVSERLMRSVPPRLASLEPDFSMPSLVEPANEAATSRPAPSPRGERGRSACASDSFRRASPGRAPGSFDWSKARLDGKSGLLVSNIEQ